MTILNKVKLQKFMMHKQEEAAPQTQQLTRAQRGTDTAEDLRDLQLLSNIPQTLLTSERASTVPWARRSRYTSRSGSAGHRPCARLGPCPTS